MRNRIGISAVIVALALGTTLVTVTPASAAAVHTATATPSTGLSEGQTVTVTGTGFDETPVIYDWSVTQCRGTILDAPIDINAAINECDGTNVVFAHADAAGNLSTSFVVHKQLSLGYNGAFGSYTCGQAPNDCAILIAQLADGGTTQLVTAATPISFGTPTKTLGDCIRDFLGDHHHSARYRFHRLLVCIFTVLTHRPPS